MVGKNQDAVALGSRGGSAKTPEQQAARRRNILHALAKRHPNSVKIKQELEKLEEK